MAWTKVATNVCWYIGVLNGVLYGYAIVPGGKGKLVKIASDGTKTEKDIAYIAEGSPHAVTIGGVDGVVYYGKELETDTAGWVYEDFS